MGEGRGGVMTPLPTMYEPGNIITIHILLIISGSSKPCLKYVGVGQCNAKLRAMGKGHRCRSIQVSPESRAFVNFPLLVSPE